MVDAGHDAARDIIDVASGLELHSANEATTRLKIIDRIIFEVLGWQHSDVEVEEHIREDGVSEYADYVLRTAMTALVIEAKKIGNSFENIETSRSQEKVNVFTRSAAGPAILQARDYARKLGVPFATVTNGNQWIVFAASRTDQVTFESSTAIIFPSLEVALKENIDEFQQLLSRDAVIAGNLEHKLTGRLENQSARQRLNDHYKESFSKIKRQSIFHLIEDEISTAFSEDIVFSSPELLEKLYVNTPDRTRFDTRIEMHIQKRRSAFSEKGKSGTKAFDARSVAKKVASASERIKPIAVIVLGTVGSGKTTFLQHTRYVKNKEYFEQSKTSPYPHWLYVDYKAFIPSSDSAEFLYSALFSYIQKDPFLSDLDKCIKHAYSEEIAAMSRGPLKLLDDEAEKKKKISEFLIDEFSKRNNFVDKVLSYSSSQKPIFLIIDNVDQFEEEEVHKRIYGDATAIAFKNNLNLFISLRDATYVSNRNLPLFDAFDFDPIYVDPPIIEAVLSRRFFVAKQLMENKRCSFTAENGAEFKIENKAIICELIQQSVLGTEVGRLIEVMATADIRLALRMTRQFLRSGYTSTGKALETYHKTGKYTFPIHEALRAIMLGSSNVYSDEFSDVGNPLDAKIDKTECQLLRLYIMTAMVNLSSNPRFRSYAGADIQQNLRNIGYGDDIVQRVLSDLCRFRYLLTTSHSAPDFDSDFLPSRFAGYVVRELLANFAFLENLMTDTFIPDKSVWTEIYDLTAAIYDERHPNKRLTIRKKRVSIFFAYMLEFFATLTDESQRRGLPPEWCTNPFDAISSRFNENLARASRSALRIDPNVALEGLNQRDAEGTIKMFDPGKKFAFVTLDEGADAYVSPRVTARTSKDTLKPGQRVICKIIDGKKGYEVIALEPTY